jgi:hypothetical protein
MARQKKNNLLERANVLPFLASFIIHCRSRFLPSVCLLTFLPQSTVNAFNCKNEMEDLFELTWQKWLTRCMKQHRSLFTVREADDGLIADRHDRARTKPGRQ